MRILLIENDPQFGVTNPVAWDHDSYMLDKVHSTDNAIIALRLQLYACLLLDLNFLITDDKNLIKKLRDNGFTGVILIVATRDQAYEKIVGPDTGADDFIIKSFDSQELTARIWCARQRNTSLADTLIHYGAIEIDVAAKQVRQYQEPVTLTSKEFDILYMLIVHAGVVQAREQLEETLYGWRQEIESNVIQVHVHHLRKKLGKELIRTIHGVGYMVEKHAY